MIAGQVLEEIFKSSWKDEYLKWICGYANAQGGTLYIGTDDDGNVVGIDNAKDMLEIIPNKITDTVKGIRTMMELLKESVEAMKQADGIRSAQSIVINETVAINEDIAKSITKENSEFGNITGMVQRNAEDIVVLSNQVDSINAMIAELEEILEG